MTDEIYLKNSLTVNNSIITLGDTDDSGKGRHFKSRFIQPGLAGYPGQYGNALIKKENLDKFVYTLRNKPVIINHKDEIEEKDKVGEVFNVWFNPDDGWYWCDGIITDVTAQNLIKDKGWSVSCSYNFTSYNDDGGTENNVPYDIEFLDGEFMHLAIVDKPRYEGANIVMNAKDKDDKGEWITVKGNHILVKEGQTKEEAVKEFINKQQDKSSDKKDVPDAKDKHGFKKDKDSGYYMKDLSDGTSVYVEKKKGEQGEKEPFFLEATHFDKNGKTLSKKQYHYDSMDGMFDKINKDFVSKDKSGDNKGKERNSTKDFRNHIDRIEKLIKKYNLEPHEEDELLDELGSFEAKLDENLEPRQEEELREKLFDFEDDIKRNQEMKKDEKEASETKDKKEEAQKPNIDKMNFANKGNADGPILIKGEKRCSDYKDTYKYVIERTEKIFENAKKEREPLQSFEANIRNLNGNYAIRDVLRDRGEQYHAITQQINKYQDSLKEKLKANNSLTEKEITMSVLNELESFVKGVIRNANDEDEKEIKNEKVDKRELIEEVGGMLKGKVDDEIIRTIIKKMEEASYDESEAGSADNKKVKNESEEEKEDKKAENKKVKNEESEDDKEKVEELKKDEKEDVENKCNNSKTDFYDKMNKIYNSSLTPSKSETEYTSRADRLKAGEEYFKV